MSQVVYKKEDNIAIISIDRPEALNALSRSIVDEIDKLVDQIQADPDIRCVVNRYDPQKVKKRGVEKN